MISYVRVKFGTVKIKILLFSEKSFIHSVKFKEVKRVFSVGVSSEFSCIGFITIVTFLKLEKVSKTQYLFSEYFL